MLGFDTVEVGPRLVASHQPIWEIVEHEIPILDTAKFAAIVGIGPKFGYNSVQTLSEPGSVATARVFGKHHWATNLTHISVAKANTTSSVCQHGCAAIVDSGTSLIAAPASALMELGHLIGQIKEDCAASVDCVWIVCGVV
eukprot:g10619.t1